MLQVRAANEARRDEERGAEMKCDRCYKDVPELRKFPFLFLDKNETRRPDLGDGYRQYWGCEDCVSKEEAFARRKST
jgi:hypothetical protein